MTSSSADSPAGVPSTDIHAVLADVLPSVLPGALVDGEAGEILVPLGADRARISTRSLQTACQGEPSSRWPQIAGQWLSDVKSQVDSAATAESRADISRLRAQAVPRGPEAPPGLSSPFNSAFDLVAVEDRGLRTAAAAGRS